MPTRSQREHSMTHPDRYGIGGRTRPAPGFVEGTEFSGLNRAARRHMTQAQKRAIRKMMKGVRRG